MYKCDTMIDKEGLVNYIRKQLKDGYDKNTILNFLTQNNYDQKMVAECFNIVERGAPTLAQDTTAVNQSEKLLGNLSKLSLYVYILLGLVVVIGIGYFIITAISGSDGDGPASTAIENPGRTTPNNPELNGDNNQNQQANANCGSTSVSKIKQKMQRSSGQEDRTTECFQDILFNCQDDKKIIIMPSSKSASQIMLTIIGFSGKDCEIDYSAGKDKKTCVVDESTLKKIAPSNSNRTRISQEILLDFAGEPVTNPTVKNLNIGCE